MHRSRTNTSRPRETPCRSIGCGSPRHRRPDTSTPKARVNLRSGQIGGPGDWHGSLWWCPVEGVPWEVHFALMSDRGPNAERNAQFAEWLGEGELADAREALDQFATRPPSEPKSSTARRTCAPSSRKPGRSSPPQSLPMARNTSLRSSTRPPSHGGSAPSATGYACTPSQSASATNSSPERRSARSGKPGAYTSAPRDYGRDPMRHGTVNDVNARRQRVPVIPSTPDEDLLYELLKELAARLSHALTEDGVRHGFIGGTALKIGYGMAPYRRSPTPPGPPAAG